MTNRLKSPELSRRGFLIATGTLGALTGVALAGCGKERTGETQQNGTSENELMESERAAEEFEFDKTLFENWDAKGYPEKATAMLQWLAANDIDEPMPEYEMGEGSHNNVPALAKWAVDNLYYPLRNAYHGNNKDGTPSINGVVDETHRAYADSMAKDVFTCGGKNTSKSS